ncbi:MAG TPA: hypothetical protein VMW75_07910 [Thermoanaerobaculia bacterium]|nr:hypothetical protein [Thermoanaerobaculia bacterium]
MMTMREKSLALLFCTCAALLAGGRSQAHAAAGSVPMGYEKLRTTRGEGPTVEGSNGTQFLAADSKGHPLLLRGDTLEVFRPGPEERFDRRVGKLACSRSSDAGFTYAAAMDPTGSTWAVGSPSDVALCDFKKEQRPPGLDWMVSSLTYSRSGPLVAVAALGPAPDGTDNFRRTQPRVFGLVDDRWQPVVSAPIRDELQDKHADQLAVLAELKAHPMEVLAKGKAESDALICTTRKGEIWLASWNSYRLQRVSASEKPHGPEREIVVGSGEVEWPKQTKEGQEREGRDRKAQGVEAVPSTVGGAVPRAVVRALLCDREIYLVVSTADGLALDRFDPAQNVLERVLLDGVKVDSSGPMTAALGGDQLWLAGRFAADGLWRISLEDLGAAHWKQVRDVRIDGKP